MTVVNAEGLELWISEQLDLPRDVVEAVLMLEFEYMVGVGIIEMPDYEFQLFRSDELQQAPRGEVDIDLLAQTAEEKLGIFSETALSILHKETDFLQMRGLVSDGPD